MLSCEWKKIPVKRPSKSQKHSIHNITSVKRRFSPTSCKNNGSLQLFNYHSISIYLPLKRVQVFKFVRLHSGDSYPNSKSANQYKCATVNKCFKHQFLDVTRSMSLSDLNNVSDQGQTIDNKILLIKKQERHQSQILSKFILKKIYRMP